MTVVIALRCADGIVMGSDSQITDPGLGLTYQDQKLHPLGERAAWGGSGSRAALYDIEQTFAADAAAIVDADDVGRALQARVDRKSTRLNSSHSQTSYAVCCWTI